MGLKIEPLPCFLQETGGILRKNIFKYKKTPFSLKLTPTFLVNYLICNSVKNSV